MQVFILLLLLLSGVLTQDCQNCRAGAGCCCKNSMINDPSNGAFIYCPCQASAPVAVLDTSITVSCDPGYTAGCTQKCEWRTPMGNCFYENSKWSCDPAVTGVDFKNQNCDIQVQVTSALLGNWTCLSSVSIGRKN